MRGTGKTSDATGQARSPLLISSRGITAALLAFAFALAMFAFLAPANAQQESSTGAQAGQQTSPKSSAVYPRGVKLMLKNGSFQLVRQYQVIGDRVCFYSLDNSDWEEMPASMVDWTATKKEEAQATQADAALMKQVIRQEDQRRRMPLEVDASLEVSPGIFLPPGEGVFVFTNKNVLQLSPAEPTYKTDKKHEIGRVLSPIPIVSSRHSVLIKGAHAKIRVKTGQPEFYVRIARDAPPLDLQLVPAQVRGSNREIARIDALFKMENATTHPLLMQRWQIAKDVYRFTLGETLPPGEYALVQVISGDTQLDQLSINVWDFGVDPSSAQEK
jgi:hypothetical protein